MVFLDGSGRCSLGFRAPQQHGRHTQITDSDHGRLRDPYGFTVHEPEECEHGARDGKSRSSRVRAVDDAGANCGQYQTDKDGATTQYLSLIHI